jgi:TOBE domain-containing protein
VKTTPVIRQACAFGPVVRIELDLAKGVGTIEARLPRGQVEGLVLSRGQRVYVSPSNIRVFANDV